ncbi:hypothetical protein F5B22DRAFT_639731 [Xylaria bambusicola]|uniref:uncharacterized protein n=1 Tax=Xylaria bambusicola TaxID=326684 RepID=UPI002007F513|nr:uncharacterized protein F5B22DRAFT_639731 [Xylaria bambusicola]KAI0505776.1 hypothetical protein F5B22DRAFT_639731 [Xylaria bambusicola]
MEQTFMTIHNLSCDANILFCTESVVDILGYQPHEILGKSSFDYFHPDEVPFARSVHNRGVLLDKAAVLHYARILSKDGRWVSCECCFTVVHNVLVACTSIYRRGEKSERRAIEAPQIRRIFSCSPRDPRYHMLEHLSPKFKMQPTEREPRAALILNRFTRTLTIMFATNAVSLILGVGPDELKGKSLYECIAENCWGDAIRCLESAKANDSIAYLRFWSRDPRVRQDPGENEGDIDMEDQQDTASENDSDGGVSIRDQSAEFIKRETTSSPQPVAPDQLNAQHQFSAAPSSRAQVISPEGSQRLESQQQLPARGREPIPTRELEAVVSCTSDGLVMVLRRARPQIPSLRPPMLPTNSENGLFAAPWSEHPVRPNYPPEPPYNFQPPYLPQYMPVREDVKAAEGPPSDQLMKSIRDVAVFAWGLVGINGNLATYARGNPSGESQPPDGLPIWDPTASENSYLGPEPLSSSRYRRDRPMQERQADTIPPRHLSGFERQYRTHTHDPADSVHSSSSNPSQWRDPMVIRPSQQLQPCSSSQQQRQQQQPFAVSGYQNNFHPQQWSEPSVPANRLDVNEDQGCTTQATAHGNSPEDFSQLGTRRLFE